MCKTPDGAEDLFFNGGRYHLPAAVSLCSSGPRVLRGARAVPPPPPVAATSYRRPSPPRPCAHCASGAPHLKPGVRVCSATVTGQKFFDLPHNRPAADPLPLPAGWSLTTSRSTGVTYYIDAVGHPRRGSPPAASFGPDPSPHPQTGRGDNLRASRGTRRGQGPASPGPGCARPACCVRLSRQLIAAGRVEDGRVQGR